MRTFLLLTILLVHSVHAEDWPQFRGPAGNGHSTETGLPVRWSPTDNIRWQQTIAGNGWSSPVVAGDFVYLTSAVPLDEQGDAGSYALTVICCSKHDGAIQWQREVLRQDGAQAPDIHDKNSHASPTPVVDGQQLFVHFGHMGTACLDTSGKVLWTQRLAYQPVHGNGGSPILAGQHLVFSCDGSDAQFVVALDKTTGEVQWKTDRNTDAAKTFSFSTPHLITVEGLRQVISPGSNCVLALDPVTGREYWRVRYDGYSVVPRPLFGRGLVFMATGFGQTSVMAIRPSSASDPLSETSQDITDSHVQWTIDRAAPHTPSMLLVDDLLFFVSDGGVASCVDADSGQRHWRKRLGGNHSASPVLAEGRIYFLSEEGLTTVVRASRDFEVVARNDMRQRALASLAVSDGSIFLRTLDQLVCIHQKANPQ